MFDFVRCEPTCGWRPTDMLERVFAAVEDYKKTKLSWKKEFLSTELYLAKIGQRVGLRGARTENRLLKGLLSNLQDAIEEKRKMVRATGDSSRRSPLGPWAGLWPKRIRVAEIKREIDLDTRLQIESAKMFRIFLHEDEGVSLRTIARLIVLVYSAAGIATEPAGNEGELTIVGSSRSISVRSVEDKLRKKGFVKSRRKTHI